MKYIRYEMNMPEIKQKKFKCFDDVLVDGWGLCWIRRVLIPGRKYVVQT